MEGFLAYEVVNLNKEGINIMSYLESTEKYQ